MTKVHPSAVVHEDVELGDGVEIGPHCVIDSGVTIGAGTVLEPNVIIGKDVTIGRENRLFPGCVIGGPPQILGIKRDAVTGVLVIGDRNTIREQVTIHPSMHAGGCTRIGSDSLLMIGAHIGHDCVLEDKLVLSNYVQIAGHCKIETGVWFSGMVASHQFVTIGKWCYAAGLAGINHDIPPFVIVSGHYPPRIRGVNKRGLMRAGLSQEQQDKIQDAYRKLYRRGGVLLERAKELAAEDGLDENVRAMIDVIVRSSEQRFGRYLEKFRH
jgi:UDP-N-acetylglucosamine acyltransferase